MTESMPSTLETISSMEKSSNSFLHFFFKFKKQEEEVEAIQEESRREIIFISWKFKCMLSLHNPHKNIVLRHQPLCTDEEVLQSNISYPAALTISKSQQLKTLQVDFLARLMCPLQVR